MLNKYAVHDGDTAPFDILHGRRATVKLAELGEKVSFGTPPSAGRSSTSAWVGVHLGTTMNTNECVAALKNGDATRAKSIVRIRPTLGRSLPWIESTAETPSKHVATNADSVIEAYADPAPDVDAERRTVLEAKDFDDEQPTQHVEQASAEKPNDLPCVPIARKELATYGYTDGCPRCNKTKVGKHDANLNHSRICRQRVLKAIKSAEGHKLRNWLKINPVANATRHPQAAPLAPSSSQPICESAPPLRTRATPPNGPLVPEDLIGQDFGEVVERLLLSMACRKLRVVANHVWQDCTLTIV